MSQSIQLILANAAIQRRHRSLLGWDGQASASEVLNNLAYRVRSFCGWTKVNVTKVNHTVVVQVQEDNGQVQTLLEYNAATDHEVSGHLCHLGLSTANLCELKNFLLAD